MWLLCLCRLTVEEHIYFYGRLKGCSRQQVKVEAEQMIKDVGLPHKRRELAKNLSGGSARRHDDRDSRRDEGVVWSPRSSASSFSCPPPPPPPRWDAEEALRGHRVCRRLKNGDLG